jgi:hypothetical protein
MVRSAGIVVSSRFTSFRLAVLTCLQEKLDAARAMQRAIVVAQNSTAGVAVVANHFESLQVCGCKYSKLLCAGAMPKSGGQINPHLLLITGLNDSRIEAAGGNSHPRGKCRSNRGTSSGRFERIAGYRAADTPQLRRQRGALSIR